VAKPVDTYTHGHQAPVVAMHATRTAANSAAYLVPHLGPDQRLLDVGCGPGTITTDLAALVAPGAVHGLEIDDAICAQARAHAEQVGATNVEIVRGNVYALDYEDGAFDVVHLHQVLQHLTDPVAALAECRRVTRPGGLVAARDVDYATMCASPKDARLDRWLELYHQVAYRNDAEPDAGRYLLSWARRAGFEAIEVSASTMTYHDEAGRHFWGEGWANRCTSSAFGQQAIAYGLADRDELDEIATAWRDWARHEEGFFLYTNVEILARRT